jgi:hypothetical protein
MANFPSKSSRLLRFHEPLPNLIAQVFLSLHLQLHAYHWLACVLANTTEGRCNISSAINKLELKTAWLIITNLFLLVYLMNKVDVKYYSTF